MVEILLHSITASRSGNLQLHLRAVGRMYFSMNHHNYAKGVTLYLQNMVQIPEGIKKDLERGMLSVKRVAGTFNSVACNQALEQSQIRSSSISVAEL